MLGGGYSKGWDSVCELFETLIDVRLSFPDFHPPKHSLPFLPKSPKCLKPGQLAKVIAKTGKVVVGRIRYCGPVASADVDETYVGLQLPNALGDCDGSIGGKKFFDWWVACWFKTRHEFNDFLSPFTQRGQFRAVCAIQEGHNGVELVDLMEDGWVKFIALEERHFWHRIEFGCCVSSRTDISSVCQVSLWSICNDSLNCPGTTLVLLSCHGKLGTFDVKFRRTEIETEERGIKSSRLPYWAERETSRKVFLFSGRKKLFLWEKSFSLFFG